jgi:tripartite-type tricarboxylate transporter receptor subunit TctC
MTISRLAALAAALVFATPVAAQTPGKTITIVVPYAAGGGTDSIARIIADHMSRTLGQSVIVENVVGAGGTTANDRVAKSAPDGATVLINHLALLAAPSLFSNLRYDTKTAFEPAGVVNSGPLVLIARKTLPGATPKEAFAWIKETGAKANVGHGGIGTNSHLCAVLMGNVLGFKPTFVAYRGSAPAINDLAGGQIDLLWDQATNAIPHAQGGTVRALAVTSAARMPQIPDVPTTAEIGLPEVSYTLWHGLYVAKGTPKEVVDRLNDALRKALADKDVAAKLDATGAPPLPEAEQTVAAHAKLFESEFARITKLVESSGAKPSEAK